MRLRRRSCNPTALHRNVRACASRLRISNVNRKEAIRASIAGRRLVTETDIVLRLSLNLDHSQALRAGRERNLSTCTGREKNYAAVCLACGISRTTAAPNGQNHLLQERFFLCDWEQELPEGILL